MGNLPRKPGNQRLQEMIEELIGLRTSVPDERIHVIHRFIMEHPETTPADLPESMAADVEAIAKAHELLHEIPGQLIARDLDDFGEETLAICDAAIRYGTADPKAAADPSVMIFLVGQLHESEGALYPEHDTFIKYLEERVEISGGTHKVHVCDCEGCKMQNGGQPSINIVPKDYDPSRKRMGFMVIRGGNPADLLEQMFASAGDQPVN